MRRLVNSEEKVKEEPWVPPSLSPLSQCSEGWTHGTESFNDTIWVRTGPFASRSDPAIRPLVSLMICLFCARSLWRGCGWVGGGRLGRRSSGTRTQILSFIFPPKQTPLVYLNALVLHSSRGFFSFCFLFIHWLMQNQRKLCEEGKDLEYGRWKM